MVTRRFLPVVNIFIILLPQILTHSAAQQPTDDQWSEWSDWTECSAHCGPGIESRERKCYAPFEQRGLLCKGDGFQTRSCETRPCPPDQPSAHEAECSKYNSRNFAGKRYVWEPFTHTTSPCKMACRAKGEHFYANLAGRAIDGTPCGRGTAFQGICISGACLRTGCDGIVGSTTKRDACGVCQGDGSSCKTISGIFTSTNLRRGLNDVISIPPGSSHINITELQPSRNLLILQTFEGKLILNDGMRNPKPGDIQAAGTVFTYTAKSMATKSTGSIFSPGPTSVGIKVKLLLRGRSPAIKYSFNVPEAGSEALLERINHAPKPVQISAEDAREKMGVASMGSEPVRPSRDQAVDAVEYGNPGEEIEEDEEEFISEESESDAENIEYEEETGSEYLQADESRDEDEIEGPDDEEAVSDNSLNESTRIDDNMVEKENDESGSSSLEESYEDDEEDDESSDESDSESYEEDADEDGDVGEREDTEEITGEDEQSSSLDSHGDRGKEIVHDTEGSEDDDEESEEDMEEETQGEVDREDEDIITEEDIAVDGDEDGDNNLDVGDSEDQEEEEEEDEEHDSEDVQNKNNYDDDDDKGEEEDDSEDVQSNNYDDDDAQEEEEYDSDEEENEEEEQEIENKEKERGDIEEEEEEDEEKEKEKEDNQEEKSENTDQIEIATRKSDKQLPQYSQSFAFGERHNTVQSKNQQVSSQHTPVTRGAVRRSGKTVSFGLQYLDDKEGKNIQKRNMTISKPIHNTVLVNSQRYRPVVTRIVRTRGGAARRSGASGNTVLVPTRRIVFKNKPTTHRFQRPSTPTNQHQRGRQAHRRHPSNRRNNGSGEEARLRRHRQREAAREARRLRLKQQRERYQQRLKDYQERLRRRQEENEARRVRNRQNWRRSGARGGKRNPSSVGQRIKSKTNGYVTTKDLRAKTTRKNKNRVYNGVMPRQPSSNDNDININKPGAIPYGNDELYANRGPALAITNNPTSQTLVSIDEDDGYSSNSVNLDVSQAQNTKHSNLPPTNSPVIPRIRGAVNPRPNILPRVRAHGYLDNSADQRPTIISALSGGPDPTRDIHLNNVISNSGDTTYLKSEPAGTTSGATAWKISGLTNCTVKCGGGVQQTVVVCVDTVTQAVVTDDNCRYLTRPDLTAVKCNTRPCPAQWIPGHWSACSATCGRGQHTRKLTCQRRVSPTLNLTMPESSCEGQPRPEVTESCIVSPCASWRVGNWSQCSARCGEGQRTRDVDCVNPAGDIVLSEECTELRPDRQQPCGQGPCGKGWFFQEWPEECPVECGKGEVTRKIFCAGESGEILSHEQCDPIDQPDTKRDCRSNRPCGGHWFAGPWSKCNTRCGPGQQTREVLCIKSLSGGVRASVGHENCEADKKPDLVVECQVKKCNAEWYMTSWGQCSKSCDTGFRTREVRCLSPSQTASDQCPVGDKPVSRETCNTQRCRRVYLPTRPRSTAQSSDSKDTQSDPKCVDQFSQCPVVKRARMCRYKFYKKRCCRSCAGE